LLCEALDIHPSGYYAWLKQPTTNRQQQDKRLILTIKQFWLESGGHNGYRNIYLDLKEAKIECGRDRVLRLMREIGLKAQRGYKTPKGYYGGTPDTVTANQLQREVDVEKPNQWWVSDITYIHTQEGFLFLAVVMDLYARNIVGWSMGHRITDDLTLDALTMAY
jgi:putative transposase